MNGFEGTRALLQLVRLRTRGRLRRLRRNLARPKTLLLGVLGLAFVGLLLAGQMFGREAQSAGGGGGAVPTVELLAFFVTVFMVTTVLGGVRQGVMAFSPAEVHFLLPAPVGPRALVLAHVLDAALKVGFSALVLAVFLVPAGISRARAFGGYLAVFLVLVVLGLLVDLLHGGLPTARRRRRARRLGAGLLAAGLAVAALRLPAADGDVLGALAPLGWPAWPFAQLLAGDDPAQVALGGGLALAALVGLLGGALALPGRVRETARGTSELVHARLEQLRRGRWAGDRPRALTRGSRLPMLPAWGGAGPHLWRQLVTLGRTRRGLAMLLWMTAAMLVPAFVVGGRSLPPVAAASVGVVAPMFMGCMFLQCDFRSDYDSLAWLRSLPAAPTALAAGQMLGSTLVIFVLQLPFVGWALVAGEPALRGWVLGCVPLLPALVLLQLCVENGAYLLAPHPLPGTSGQPPGAGQLLRFYGLTIVKLLVLAVALLPPAGALLLLARGLGQPVLGLLVGGALLWLETVLAVAAVGRIFLAVDPGRDLSSD